MWPLGAPDGSTNYYKRLHPLDLSVLLPEMLEKEGRIKLQNSTLTLQMLSFIVLPETQLSAWPHTNTLTCQFSLAFVAWTTVCDYYLATCREVSATNNQLTSKTHSSCNRPVFWKHIISNCSSRRSLICFCLDHWAKFGSHLVRAGFPDNTLQS